MQIIVNINIHGKQYGVLCDSGASISAYQKNKEFIQRYTLTPTEISVARCLKYNVRPTSDLVEDSSDPNKEDNNNISTLPKDIQDEFALVEKQVCHE